MKTVKNYVSQVYLSILDEEILELRVPNEFLSTCQKCPMTISSDKKVKPFSKKTKCCTWYPFIPNYLVGGILSKESEDFGRKKIIDEMVSNDRVSPFGIFPSSEYLGKASKMKIVDFGRTESCKCPFLSKDQSCSIWDYRDSTCSTWFCKPILGKSGNDFWQSLNSLLGTLQDILIKKVLTVSGCDDWSIEYGQKHNSLKSRTQYSPIVSEFSKKSMDEKILFFKNCYDNLQMIDYGEVNEAIKNEASFLAMKKKSLGWYGSEWGTCELKTKLGRNTEGNYVAKIDSSTSIILNDDFVNTLENKSFSDLPIELQDLALVLKFNSTANPK